MSNPHNLASLESLDEGPVRLTTCRKWEHALYPNEADKAQQLGMMVSFIRRAQQSKPETLGMMMYFDLDTPMYCNGKENCGGPVLGWPDFLVVQATGSECYRYYTKDTIGKEINVEPMTPELIASMTAKGDLMKDSRDPGEDGQIILSIQASSGKFKEHYPGPVR